MPTPQALLNDIRTGPPVTCKNLELVPLLKANATTPAIDYILAADALDRGILRVAEVDEDGSVPELRAVSEAATHDGGGRDSDLGPGSPNAIHCRSAP